jgi:prepilin-type N-terminal cleavage/methylation domain-containing protein
MRTSGIPSHRLPRSARGFTLVELMITLVILGVVMLVLSTIINTAARSKTTTANNLDSSQMTRIAVDLIARDLRDAGYGADADYPTPPQPPIAYIDSMQVLMAADLDTSSLGPRAYNPAGNPQPFPLSGTSWTPPVTYGTGAETIRWTFDTNNDGSVTSADQNAANGIEASRTKNPNDYMLVREVYGEGTAGNNGGTVEKISLLRKPADSGVPPLFTVYLFGDPNPWSWSNGPIPAARLRDIERVVVRGVGTSPKPNWLGQYATTEYRTEVTTTRNIPNFGSTEYAVDGYVYVDLNGNNNPDIGTDEFVKDATLNCAGYGAVSDSNGYYLFKVPAGSYTLRHSPPPGYQNATIPDSFLVSVGPAQRRSFKETKLLGGHVGVYAFADSNGNGTQDAGEPSAPNISVKLTQTGEVEYTSASGAAALFAPVGTFTVQLTLPAGYTVTTTHPYTGSMVNGGTDSVRFGIQANPTGTIAGKVFIDTNRNGVFDTGEPGVQNVWVGASPDGGLTVVGYKYTDVNGDYVLTVPSNDPPATQPYYATLIVPNGYYPTGSTSIGPLLVQAGQNLTGKNFGVASFQVITLNASRVLSVSSADLVEKDWSGNDDQWDTKGHQDADIVLGADAGGTDNISVWFNDYNSTPLFTPNPTYTRNAPNSVLSLKLDMLDKNVPTSRFDAVTGTRYTAGVGNFFVWFAQNSGGNLGYFSATQNLSYSTADLGDVQALLTADVGGGASPDIIVGTKSPTAGQGHIEIWLNDEATNPTFTRDEIYPPQGNMPGNNLGEVTSMTMADLDNDGDKDLVVGTRTGSYTGQVIVFENTGRTTGARFRERWRREFTDQAITTVTCMDMNGDGWKDIITGSQQDFDHGRLEQWANVTGLSFALARSVQAGIVMSLIAADMGGAAREDLIVGWRSTETSYSGGISIFFTDLGVIPPFASDPSNGAITYMVPALTSNNFNYGVQPSTPAPPFLKDVAAGIKTGPTTGALVVFIR